MEYIEVLYRAFTAAVQFRATVTPSSAVTEVVVAGEGSPQRSETTSPQLPHMAGQSPPVVVTCLRTYRNTF
jgi:hypothetical protein